MLKGVSRGAVDLKRIFFWLAELVFLRRRVNQGGKKNASDNSEICASSLHHRVFLQQYQL